VSGFSRLFEIYVLEYLGRVVYVGQGYLGRSDQWMMPSRYKLFGGRPKLVLLSIANSKKKALATEARLIELFKPTHNKALRGSTGGLAPWNKDLRGDVRLKGGRPRGIPMSDLTKRRLSAAMKGKVTAWMKGRKPWNKGLHTSKV
jgi:hypothetical protein